MVLGKNDINLRTTKLITFERIKSSSETSSLNKEKKSSI